MRCYPSGDSDTYRSQLFIAYPDSCKTRNSHCVDIVILCDANHDFLDIADVAMDIATIRFQIDDRITNNLSRSVISHISASAGFKEFYTFGGSRVFVDKNIARISTAPKRQNVRMLQQQ